VPAPTIALYEGRALSKVHRLVEAEEAYMRAVRTSLDSESPEQFRKAVRDAESELLALRPKIPKLTIVPSGPGGDDPGLVVLLDGNEVNRAVLGVEMPVDPGDHEIVATAPGGQEVKQRFTLGENDRKRIEIEVPDGRQASAPSVGAEEVRAGPRPAARPPVARASATPPAAGHFDQRLFGFIAGGVGVAGLGTGVVAGLMSAARHSDAESQCSNHACVEGTAGADALQSFRTLRTVSTIGYIVGGLGVAAGATLLLTAPAERRAQSAFIRPWISANAAGVAGTF
jgi:hypothetical protein